MFLLFFILGVFAFFYYHSVHKCKGLPPGPTPYPLIGNMLEIVKDPPGEAVFKRWRDKYGDVFTYWLGGLPVVSVHDYQTIMDTFQKDGESYAGRYSFTEFMEIVRGGNMGILGTDGELWREQKAFVLQVLRDFGMGKNLIQERIIDEVYTIFEKIDKNIKNGLEEHDLYGIVDIGVGSIINSMLFGYRFHGEKENEFVDLKNRVRAHVEAMGHPLIEISLSHPNFFKNLPFFKDAIGKAKSTADYLFDFYRKQIREHHQTFDENAESADFVHAFIKEWNKRDKIGEKHYFSAKQLEIICFDMFFAGQETTANSIAWGFAYLVHHPEVQEKCHAELDRIIGSDRIVRLSDKPNLIYCNATINEILRIGNIVPQNIIHKTAKDVVIQGHHIKKGTAILPQISVILSDDKIYPNPQYFQPERFIDSEGKLKRAEELIAFSVGKRQCLGESLARTELFLFVVNILNRYRLLPGAQKPNLQRKAGGVVKVDKFLCQIKKRY